MPSYTDLEVYKTCRKLRMDISKLVETEFPKDEKFRLSDQVIRSSRSVTACIAEGYGRFNYKDDMRFLKMAKGSLFETLEHLITAYDEKIITEETLKNYKNDIDTCGRLLSGYIKYLKNKDATS
jgi:four helix bundle protein